MAGGQIRAVGALLAVVALLATLSPASAAPAALIDQSKALMQVTTGLYTYFANAPAYGKRPPGWGP